MVHIVAPQVHPGVDALGGQHLPHGAGGVQAFALPAALAHAQNDLALVVQLNVGVVGGHVGQKIQRGIVVHQIVAPAIPEELGAVTARLAQQTGEQVGAAEKHNGRVGGPQAEPGDQRQVMGGVHAVDQRHHLVHNVVVVLLLHPGAVGRVAIGVGPAFGVHRVHAEELNAAALDGIAEGIGHIKALPVVAHTVLAGEGQHRHAVVAVDQQVHPPLQALAVLGNEFAFHGNHPFTSQRYWSDYTPAGFFVQSRILSRSCLRVRK